MHAPSPVADRPLIGIALRLLSASGLAGMAALLKAASERGVAAPEMIFYRSAAALPLVLLWAATGPGLGALRTRRPMAHATRTALGFTTMLLTFVALSRLPLGEATTITYTAPIFGTILSALVLREAIGRHRWGAVAVGFLGMLLVVRPGGQDLSPVGVAAGLGSAIGTAAVMVTLRQIGKSETTASIVFWFLFLSTLGGLGLLAFFGRAHDPVTYALLTAAGLFGGVGQISLTASLRFAPVSTVMPFDYLQILWATLIGWLVFADAPTLVTLMGAALIAGSGIYTAYRERRHGLVPAQSLAPPEG